MWERFLLVLVKFSSPLQQRTLLIIIIFFGCHPSFQDWKAAICGSLLEGTGEKKSSFSTSSLIKPALLDKLAKKSKNKKEKEIYLLRLLYRTVL